MWLFAQDVIANTIACNAVLLSQSEVFDMLCMWLGTGPLNSFDVENTVYKILV